MFRLPNFKTLLWLMLAGWLFAAPGVNAQQPVDLLDYLFPRGSPGTPISSGEFFKPVQDGVNGFKVLKSQNPNFYEKFRWDGSFIYHVEDTTWATQEGDVACQDTGQEATLTYAEGEIRWVERFMQPEECFTSSATIQGINEVTGQICPTAHSGFTQRTICLRHQGCVNFPNGVTSDDSVVLEIREGAGAGEQFIYDRERGWIGFNRGVENTGAYATEQLSTRQYGPNECYQITVSPAPVRCGPGVSCIDADLTRSFGGNIEVARQSFFSRLTGSILSALGRVLIRPANQELSIPDLSFLTPLREASGPLSPHRFSLDVQGDGLPGRNFNPGCDVRVGGNSIGSRPEVDVRAEGYANYSFPQQTGEDLGYLSFFEAITNPGKGVYEKIRVKAPNEDTLPGEAENEYLKGDCPTEGGKLTEALDTPAEGQTEAQISLLDRITEIFCRLFCAPSGAPEATQSAQAAVVQVHKDKNFCAGCKTLGEKAMNVFNSRLPFRKAMEVEDAVVKNQKDVEASPAERESIDTIFPALGNVKAAHEEFQRSLYPRRLQGSSIRTLATVPKLPDSAVPAGAFSIMGEPSSPLMRNLIAEAANAFNVPPAVLSAVAWTEGAEMWSWADAQVQAYSAPGVSSPLHCGRSARIANQCGAEGPLQFLTGKDVNLNECPQADGLDVWSEWKNSVNQATGEGRSPNICNPKDALYAAAAKLKAASGSPQNLTTWTREQVFRAIRNWYGSCEPDVDTQKRFGAGKSYCEFVWEAVLSQK